MLLTMDKTHIPELLTPTEVAKIFGVSPKTVTRWAKSGQVPCLTTLGGHRRYRRTDIEALINDSGATVDA